MYSHWTGLLWNCAAVHPKILKPPKLSWPFSNAPGPWFTGNLWWQLRHDCESRLSQQKYFITLQWPFRLRGRLRSGAVTPALGPPSPAECGVWVFLCFTSFSLFDDSVCCRGFKYADSIVRFEYSRTVARGLQSKTEHSRWKSIMFSITTDNCAFPGAHRHTSSQ